MEIIYKFLQENSIITDYIVLIVYLVFSVLLFRKTGDINYLKEVLYQMKYKTEQTASSQNKAGQTFNRFVPVYRLNKATNQLEKTDDVIDMQELTNSSLDMSLNSILERYLPTGTQEQVVTEHYNKMVDDLDEMRLLNDKAEYYRQQLNLPLEYSVAQVFQAVEAKSNELKKVLDEKEALENEKKKIVE